MASDDGICREEAAGNEACRQELQSFEEWRTQRETLAVQTHMYCNTDVTVGHSKVGTFCMLCKRGFYAGIIIAL